jgi:hypothetical protein
MVRKWEYYFLMAHFAQLDENNNVITVVVVNNESIDSTNEEQSGIDFLTSLYGHSLWKQTSYNNNIRKQYAGIGFTYDPISDVFVSPQPYPSWSLNANHDWQAPIQYPEDGIYFWDEESLKWQASPLQVTVEL